jgi:hypothetical protein
MTLEERLEELRSLVLLLVERQATKEFYEVEEFARLVGKSRFTCREWCRLGRLSALKKGSGRGAHFAWVISHAELLRYQREGLRHRGMGPSCMTPEESNSTGLNDTGSDHEQA